MANTKISNEPAAAALDGTEIVLGVQTAANVKITIDQIGTRVFGSAHAAASKTTPVDADEVPLLDSASAFAVKRLTWSNLKATLRVWLTRVQALTDAATVAVDASAGDNCRVTLGGNRTLGNPTNLADGQILNFRFTQDATGSRTLAYSSKYKFAGGTAPVLSTAASAKDFMSCQYDATDDTLFCSMLKAFA